MIDPSTARPNPTWDGRGIDQYITDWHRSDWITRGGFVATPQYQSVLRGDDLLGVYHNMSLVRKFAASSGEIITPAGRYDRIVSGDQSIVTKPTRTWYYYQGKGEYASADETVDDWRFGIVQSQCRGGSSITVHGVPCGATVELLAFIQMSCYSEDIDKYGGVVDHIQETTHFLLNTAISTPKTASASFPFNDVSWTHTEIGDGLAPVCHTIAASRATNVQQKYGSYTDKRKVGLPGQYYIIPRRDFVFDTSVKFVAIVTLGNHTPGVIIT